MTFTNVHEEHKAKMGFTEKVIVLFLYVLFEMLQVFQLEQVKD